MSDNTSDDWIEVLYIESPAITLLEFRKTIAHKVNEARIKQTKRIYGMLEPMNDFTDAVPTEKLDDELERLAKLKTDTTEYVKTWNELAKNKPKVPLIKN